MAVTLQHRTLESRYDKAADWWHAKIHKLGYRTAYEDLVRLALSGIFARSVAEVGAGTGDLAASYCSILGSPKQLVLVDSSAAMLSRAVANLGEAGTTSCSLETIHSSLESYKTETLFDVVLCAHVIEHCDDPQRAIRAIAELLEPGGYALMVISRPHWCQWIIWLRWQHRWFSAPEVDRMANAAGLTLMRTIQPCSGPPSRTSFGYLMQRS